MKSLLCLTRSKRGPASQGQAQQQGPQTADHRDGENAVESSARTNKCGDHALNKGKRPQPSQGQASELRRQIENTRHVLDQIDIFIAEESPQDEEPCQKANSFTTSVALHLADLHSSAKALQAILKKKRQPRGSEKIRETSAELPRGPSRIPTLELGDSFDGNSVIHCTASVSSDDDSDISLLPSSPPPATTITKSQPDPPTLQVTELGAIAPLRIPQRSCSLNYPTTVTGRKLTCSPFEKEMRDIDRQLKESSQGCGTSRPLNKPPSASLMHRRRPNNLSIGVPCRRAVSLQTPRGFDSPTVGAFWSETAESPRGERTSFVDEPQFSTEAKARRLRSLKRLSAPQAQKRAVEQTVSAEKTAFDGGEEEPLQMEELMDFLREGNSMRDL